MTVLVADEGIVDVVMTGTLVVVVVGFDVDVVVPGVVVVSGGGVVFAVVVVLPGEDSMTKTLREAELCQCRGSMASAVMVWRPAERPLLRSHAPVPRTPSRSERQTIELPRRRPWGMSGAKQIKLISSSAPHTDPS